MEEVSSGIKVDNCTNLENSVHALDCESEVFDDEVNDDEVYSSVNCKYHRPKLLSAKHHSDPRLYR